MATLHDVYRLDVLLEQAIEAAKAANLPDTHEQLVEIRRQIVAEFKAVRLIRSAGGAYPDPL